MSPRFLLTVFLLTTLLAGPGYAEDTPLDRRTAEFASGNGNTAFLVAGTVLPWLEGNSQQGRRTADGLLLSAAVTHLLKNVVRSRRPDGSDHLSFPSGHTSAAFSLAASRSTFRPGETAFWYGGATMIGLSRMELNRHRATDVAAGAVLGFGFGATAAGAKVVRLLIRF